jgi:hypothetical protein
VERAPAREVLGSADRGFERLMLEVRLRDGLRSCLLDGEQLATASELVTEGLLANSGDAYVLTLRGRLLADLVVRRLG